MNSASFDRALPKVAKICATKKREIGNVGDSGLYHIAASSKEEARAIAADQLRVKGIPFRGLACCLGTYWRKSLDGYPCSPIRQCDRWL